MTIATVSNELLSKSRFGDSDRPRGLDQGRGRGLSLAQQALRRTQQFEQSPLLTRPLQIRIEQVAGDWARVEDSRGGETRRQAMALVETIVQNPSGSMGELAPQVVKTLGLASDAEIQTIVDEVAAEQDSNLKEGQSRARLVGKEVATVVCAILLACFLVACGTPGPVQGVETGAPQTTDQAVPSSVPSTPVPEVTARTQEGTPEEKATATATVAPAVSPEASATPELILNGIGGLYEFTKAQADFLQALTELAKKSGIIAGPLNVIGVIGPDGTVWCELTESNGSQITGYGNQAILFALDPNSELIRNNIAITDIDEATQAYQELLPNSQINIDHLLVTADGQVLAINDRSATVLVRSRGGIWGLPQPEATATIQPTKTKVSTATAEPTKTATATPTSTPTETAIRPSTATSTPTRVPTTETTKPTTVPTKEQSGINTAELRNCTTNRAEDLEAGIDWALNNATKSSGGKKEIWVNGGTEPFILTPQTKIIIEVVPASSLRAYLNFSTDNRFGYYNEGGKLLVVVRGNAPRALYRALLGLNLDNIYLLGGTSNPNGSQIEPSVWGTSEYRAPLFNLFFNKGSIDELLLSPQSMPIGG
ncbi:hypothetical protein KKF92_01030 [Patescibacteria group bacterium]|nr:hypothetical protein [Patescibacteria group bacterium]